MAGNKPQLVNHYATNSQAPAWKAAQLSIKKKIKKTDVTHQNVAIYSTATISPPLPVLCIYTPFPNDMEGHEGASHKRKIPTFAMATFTHPIHIPHLLYIF